MTAGLVAALVAAWWCLVVFGDYGGNWTGLFCAGDQVPAPPPLARSTYFVRNSTGHDGQFYRMIAHDPWLQHGYAAYLDDARLRYRRILVPAAAWALSAGSGDRIDSAYIGVVFLAMFLGAWWFGRFAVLHRRSAWWCHSFLAIPGVLCSIGRMVLDGVLAAWIAGFLLFLGTGNRAALLAVCVLAGLTRETGLLLGAGVSLFHAARGRYSQAALFALTAAPAAGWYAWIHAHIPGNGSSIFFSRPLYGLVLGLFEPRPYPRFAAFLHALDVLSILGLIVSIALAAALAWRRRAEPAGWAMALVVAQVASLGGSDLISDPFGPPRLASPVLAFLAADAALRSRWRLLPVLAQSAAVGVFVAAPGLRALSLLSR